MKKSLIILAAAGLSLLTGCVLTGCKSPVPGAHIKGTLGGVPFDVQNPKQCKIVGFNLSLISGSNTFTLSISNLTSENDPQVIDKSYAGQAAVAKEFFTGINDLASKFAEGAVKGAK